MPNKKQNDTSIKPILTAIIDKQIKQLSKMQIELLKTDISSDDYNLISDKIGNLKESMLDCICENAN